MEIPGYALVTGGGQLTTVDPTASGIGKASCHAFAREGSGGILVADINLKGAQETVDAIRSVATHAGFRAEAIHLDVSSEDSVKAAVSRMKSLFGLLSILIVPIDQIVKVPGATFDPIASASFSDFKRLLEINVHGTFLVTSLVSAAMKTQDRKPVHPQQPARGTTRGAIVNLASVSSYISVPSMVQYTTSKHAVLGITRTAAYDHVADGIRVNCVCPSWTDTPMVQTAMEVVPGLERLMVSGIPMGRLCTPEEVADTVLYLCSPRSSFTTGTGVIMDGGMSLGAQT
ncbi:NAD(P)-binding protein [Apiospora kogelbergensis]|uniref:NAD(P)-binding protein n=1 Tax=Apiospora kogelbergensis TaxID=1337665 RepID=A0AAW0QG19_9PEZI